jgi:crotonobetainyl-CoA:carnitine CoA-transferase CaiB-like acyl-CoA transferase
LTDLASETDVFLQAYRPGALEKKGFGVTDLVNLKSAAHNNNGTKEGIICANLYAWGWESPWKDRRGVSILPTIYPRPFCDG